jgi:hypothetical protein
MASTPKNLLPQHHRNLDPVIPSIILFGIWVIVHMLVTVDDFKRIFRITISDTEPISTLRKAIKEKQHAFRHVDADNPRLWKVSKFHQCVSHYSWSSVRWGSILILTAQRHVNHLPGYISLMESKGHTR